MRQWIILTLQQSSQTQSSLKMTKLTDNINPHVNHANEKNASTCSAVSHEMEPTETKRAEKQRREYRLIRQNITKDIIKNKQIWQSRSQDIFLDCLCTINNQAAYKEMTKCRQIQKVDLESSTAQISYRFQFWTWDVVHRRQGTCLARSSWSLHFLLSAHNSRNNLFTKWIYFPSPYYSYIMQAVSWYLVGCFYDIQGWR